MTVYGPYRMTVIDVYDGDTCHVKIDLGFGLTEELRCRIYGINAPELITDAGKSARDYAKRILLDPGATFTVQSYGWDKYGGRFDGKIQVTPPDGPGFDFGEAMIAANQAVPYDGR